MSLSVVSEKQYCAKCGRAYGSKKNYFNVCYASLYKGSGFLPYCKECVAGMYNVYLEKTNDPKIATRKMCRKLDLYWNEQVYDYIERKNAPKMIMSQYIQRINSVHYAGKSYDDTIEEEEDSIWGNQNNTQTRNNAVNTNDEPKQQYIVAELEPIEITEDIVAFWGPGYTPEMYIELEQRLQYYRSQMGEDQNDMSTDAILRQIVMLEIDINKARADGRAVDKMMSTFNSLMSSLNKPQTKGDGNSAAANTPLGVWVKRWEDERPLPEIDDSLKDVDGIIKYVLTWVYGHVTHMLGVRNTYSKLYEEAIEKYRVSRPEYDEEDDDTMLYDIFKDSGDSGDKAGQDS